MKWRVCSTCNYVMDEPTPQEIVNCEQVCPVCEEVHNPQKSLGDLLAELIDRIAELERSVWPEVTARKDGRHP